MLRGLSFTILLALGSLGCGETQRLNLTYTAAGSNGLDFIVIMTTNLAGDIGAFKQNIKPRAGSTVYFYTPQSLLKSCVVDQGQLADGTFGITANPVSTNCQDLGEFWGEEIFQGDLEVNPPSAALNGDFSLPTDGYVFVVFFFDSLGPDADDRKYAIFASKIVGKKFVDAAGNTSNSANFNLNTATRYDVPNP